MYSIPFLDVPALESTSGYVRPPGSKSISNRVLLLAALAPGRTQIRNLLASDDTRVMLDALRKLGCEIQDDSEALTIQGWGTVATAESVDLFLGNAGTAMRPLTAVLALRGGSYTLHGTPRMHERPIGDLVDALRPLGCQIAYADNAGYPPLRIDPRTPTSDRAIHVRGDVSSQFLTGLLMALPPLAATDPEPYEIRVDGELISRPYIALTLHLLERFGVAVQREGWSRFTIPPGSRYASPGSFNVEPDASSASYLIAAGALSAPIEGGLLVQGVRMDSVQGDVRFVDAVRQMGADVRDTPAGLRVRRNTWPLKAVDLDCNAIPDAAMTLAMLALYADGTSTLRNIASWRVKETDRLAAMATELRKLGAEIEEGADYLRITPPHNAGAWQPAIWHTYDDHRMAMCGALAAFNPARLPMRIQDPACVAKTFPDFFEALFDVARPATTVPVICIDGPAASGKGTLALGVARALGFHYLDSGALYRLTALAARRAGLLDTAPDARAIAAVACALPVHFAGERILLGGEDVTAALRAERTGNDASVVSALPAVRAALLAFQHDAARLPGLVTDGRDMGTVVFPHAALKVFLTANARVRAQRRLEQLRARGVDAKIDSLYADLRARDQRDTHREAAPLQAAEDAMLLDNSGLSIEQSVAQVLGCWQKRQPFHAAS